MFHDCGQNPPAPPPALWKGPPIKRLVAAAFFVVSVLGACLFQYLLRLPKFQGYVSLFQTMGVGSAVVTILGERVPLPHTRQQLIDPLRMAMARRAHERLEKWNWAPSVRRVQDVQVTSRGTHKIPVRLYTPHNSLLAGKNGTLLPLLVWVHGGGWTMGSIESDDKIARVIADTSGALVASVEYRLAPEHRFPAPLEDVVDVLHHLLDHGHAYGADPSRVALAGESAGGHLTILSALSVMKDRPGSLCGIVPIVPATLYGCRSASCDTFATGRLLHKSHMLLMWDATFPELNVTHASEDHNVSPLRTPPELLARLPPTLVLTADHDPLRDEGEAFYHKAKQSGVAAEHVRYNRTMHVFFGRLSTGGRDGVAHVSRWYSRTCGDHRPRALHPRLHLQ